MSIADKLKEGLSNVFGTQHTEAQNESVKAIHYEKQIVSAIVDGREVPDLVKWCIEIRDMCERSRDRYYPDEGYKQYIETCWRWYIGDHWEETLFKKKRSLKANLDKARVENRIAEKIDIIYPIMIEQKPEVKVFPRTSGADVEAATKLKGILDYKFEKMDFEKFLTKSMNYTPVFGITFNGLQHYFHRNEPDGFDSCSVYDPLSVLWDGTLEISEIEKSKILIHVDLWDTDDAECHYSALSGTKIENLPCGGEQWAKWQDYSLKHRLNSSTGWFQSEGQLDTEHLRKTLITEYWYWDGERVEEPLMQEVDTIESVDDGAGNLVPTPVKKMQQQVDPETGAPLVWYKPKYPNGRLIVMAGESQIIYDGNNPYQHGEIPIVPCLYNPDAESFIALVIDQQYAINEANSQVASHAALCGFPAVEVDETQLKSGQEFTNEPGKIYLKEGSSDKKAIIPVEYAPLNQSVLQNYNLNSDAFERITGVSYASSGAANANDSGIKITQLDDVTQRKLKPFEMSRNSMMKRLGRQELYNINQFMSADEEVRIVSDPYDLENQQTVLTLKDILKNRDVLQYDVVLGVGGGYPTSRQERADQYFKLAQTGALPASIALEESDLPKAAEQARKQEEYQRQLEQMQMQQQMAVEQQKLQIQADKNSQQNKT